MTTPIASHNTYTNRVEAPQGNNSPVSQEFTWSPTAKRIAILAIACFAAFLIVGPTFVIKTATLLVGLGCMALIFYMLWKNNESQPQGLRSSNNPGNIPTSTRTPVGGGHTPPQTSTHTGPGQGHALPKKTTQPPMPTGPSGASTHTPLGGGHQNQGSHTPIGGRAKKQ